LREQEKTRKKYFPLVSPFPRVGELRKKAFPFYDLGSLPYRRQVLPIEKQQLPRSVSESTPKERQENTTKGSKKKR